MPAPITVMLLSVLLAMGFLLVTGGNTHKKCRSWRIVCLILKKLTRTPVNRIRSGHRDGVYRYHHIFHSKGRHRHTSGGTSRFAVERRAQRLVSDDVLAIGAAEEKAGLFDHVIERQSKSCQRVVRVFHDGSRLFIQALLTEHLAGWA